MDTNSIFRIINLATAGLLLFGGLTQFFPIGIQSAIVGAYVCIFGAAIGLLEYQIPPLAKRYGSFLFSFLGRGVFYIFLGSILLHDMLLRQIAGGLVMLVGLAFVACEFVPSIEPPENMSDNDWGAEQV